MDQNEILGIRSIAEVNKEQLGDKLKNYFKLGWVFERWFEKLILLIVCYMGFWKIWELIS